MASASRGAAETERLRENVEEQLTRLLTQLQDLEDNKEDLAEEYDEMRNETLQQMQEFNEMLKKMLAGNMTLVDQIGSVQLAIQAAIRQAFKTPEVIRLFAKRQPDALRARLEDLKRDNRLGKIPDDAFGQQSSEIVAALKGLDEELTPEEQSILDNQTGYGQAFTEVEGGIGSDTQAAILSQVSSTVKEAKDF